MSDFYVIDPYTKEELDNEVTKAFNTFVNTCRRDGADFDAMDKQDIADLFFSNGFLCGCLAMTENPDVHEAIYMMRKEIEYQNKG